jgi:hypothetical protein
MHEVTLKRDDRAQRPTTAQSIDQAQTPATCIEKTLHVPDIGSSIAPSGSHTSMKQKLTSFR